MTSNISINIIFLDYRKNMKIKSLLIRIHWLLSAQFGIDLLKLIGSIRSIPRYIRDFFRFRTAGYSGKLELVPCLHDWNEEGGETKNEYFWQDLIVARKIFDAKPKRHVDIASRIDGFVAHVASFREIEVFDIRPITTKIPGVLFKQADLMESSESFTNYCDSLSCLHALEHFGLGRYGDTVDPKGYENGIRNMSRILCPGGVFYLSVPVGHERIEFNAQHVFNPKTIVDIAKSSKLELDKFSLFTSDAGMVEMGIQNKTLDAVSMKRYGLGIFSFIKK